MARIDLFDSLVNGLSASWKQQLCQGLCLVFLGILIVVLPQLLVAMAASALILAGAVMIIGSLAMKRLNDSYHHFRPDVYELF